MRTIKFRGKRLDNQEWVVGNLFIPDKIVGGVYICPSTTYANFYPDLDDKQDGITHEDMTNASKSGISLGHFIQVDPATVGQFTGLHDKDGKDIFEGDGVMANNGRKAPVVFNEGCFVLRLNDESDALLVSESISVVGNVHEGVIFVK